MSAEEQADRVIAQAKRMRLSGRVILTFVSGQLVGIEQSNSIHPTGLQYQGPRGPHGEQVETR